MRWRKFSEETPTPYEDCITLMKHGFIEGCWKEGESTFSGYYWSDIEWYAELWMPSKEFRIATGLQESGT